MSNPDATYTIAKCTGECDADPACVGFIETIEMTNGFNNGVCMIATRPATTPSWLPWSVELTDLSAKENSYERWNWWAKPKPEWPAPPRPGPPRWYDLCRGQQPMFGGGTNAELCTSAVPHMNALLDECAAYYDRGYGTNNGACDTDEYNADGTCLGCTPCSNTTCGAGEYRSGECGVLMWNASSPVTTDGYTCTPCTDGFFKEGTNNVTSCAEKKKDCGGSFIFKPSDPVASTVADNTCEACPDGTFQGSKTVCTICANNACAANEYRTGECSGTTDGFTCLTGEEAAEQAFTDLFDIFDRSLADDAYVSNDYSEDWYTDEQKAVMVIAGECKNHKFEPTDDDRDEDYNDYDGPATWHGSDSCDDGVDGCSFQFVKLPETMAAMKAIGFEGMQDDDDVSISGAVNSFGVGAWYPRNEDEFDAEMAAGGRTICLPDGFQARTAATGWSLDKYYSSLITCQVQSGDRGACAAAGCGSTDNDGSYGDDDAYGHGCVAHSHHGLTSSSAAKEAAAVAKGAEVAQWQERVDYQQEIVDYFQKEKTTACATSETSNENCTGRLCNSCATAVERLEGYIVALNRLKEQLSVAEKYALARPDSATGVTASLVVVVLSAIGTFF